MIFGENPVSPCLAESTSIMEPVTCPRGLEAGCLFICLIFMAGGAKQSRSSAGEQTTQVRVYQIPVTVDGLASLPGG